MGAVCLTDVFSELRLRVEKDKPACLYAYLAEVAKERTNVRTMSETDQACLLCDAAKSGKAAKVADLLERGVPPNASDYDKRAALHIAAEEGFLDIVRLLVERGATVDAHDRWGTTPHAGAVHKGHADVSEYLRSQGAKQPRVACSEEEGAGMLCAAAGKGNLAKMRSILDSGVCADAADYDFRIALHLAAEEGRMEACRFLLERGCDVNAQDRWGTTPLSGAEQRPRRGGGVSAGRRREADG